MDRFVVTADEQRIADLLAQSLTAEEFGHVRLARREKSGARAMVPDGQRAEPITVGTIVIWIVGGIAGNAAYDLSLKLARVLAAEFGASNVRPDEDAVPS